MAQPEIPVIDSRDIDPGQTSVDRSYVLIERNQPLPAEDVYDGSVRATYVRGFDSMGQIVDERGLLERQGLGKLQQFATQMWKVRRVKRAVAKANYLESVTSM